MSKYDSEENKISEQASNPEKIKFSSRFRSKTKKLKSIHAMPRFYKRISKNLNIILAHLNLFSISAFLDTPFRLLSLITWHSRAKQTYPSF